MKGAITLSAALLAGCTADYVEIFMEDHAGDSEATAAALSGAAEILTIDPMPVWGAALGVEIVRVLDPGPCGITFVNELAVCETRLRAPPVDVKLAHELGHALGLEHVDDNGNLMSRSSSGRELTDEQIDTMVRRAWRLNACP